MESGAADIYYAAVRTVMEENPDYWMLTDTQFTSAVREIIADITDNPGPDSDAALRKASKELISG